MGKNIVICCDGTGNEYGDRNTNVVKLFGIIEKDPEKQIAYYDPGVGTFSTPGAWTKLAKWFTKLMGLAFAYGINTNIEDAYRYLMDKYEEGDRVFLFGFSRGAFTARALAGMLHKVGLLEKGSYNLIPYAIRMYRGGESKIAAGFKATFSRECKTYFVGVWDTVKSVGLIIPRKFPNAKLNEDVSFGYHAIAIDEKRSKFRPNLWDPPTTPEQKIEQIWFAGVHSDVGGSYPEDGLSNIALKWMLDKARECELKINEQKYHEIKTDHTDKLHNSLWPYWWILGWWRRKIERGAWIHESVYKRIDDVKGYNPKNLPPKDQIKVVN
ncbi:DUF2235 domain-containing protein [candidate division KSB1 bacterium]|nr:DUF2235 domain-containing protein [candidate division KSB1 bacterium]NIR71000.1 DUF2235 domain-containing protein [candidate division KSB1 bacterium]NIS24741.1 DUF2235 domain-containing protein [candidate division KSB1 bacterium]NIT71645.1 DUF2235 domain-containing protein [candidate division KSB1 bacterium]NIU25352.1 DUF2235 domain-containing protein [candidate division KSB1 bacterium]